MQATAAFPQPYVYEPPAIRAERQLHPKFFYSSECCAAPSESQAADCMPIKIQSVFIKSIRTNTHD